MDHWLSLLWCCRVGAGCRVEGCGASQAGLQVSTRETLLCAGVSPHGWGRTAFSVPVHCSSISSIWICQWVGKLQSLQSAARTQFISIRERRCTSSPQRCLATGTTRPDAASLRHMSEVMRSWPWSWRFRALRWALLSARNTNISTCRPTKLWILFLYCPWTDRFPRVAQNLSGELLLGSASTSGSKERRQTQSSSHIKDWSCRWFKPLTWIKFTLCDGAH